MTGDSPPVRGVDRADAGLRGSVMPSEPGSGPAGADGLAAFAAEHATAIGLNRSQWPGLVLYRFEERTSLQWDQVGSVALCVVVQGRKRVRIRGVDHFYDPFHYLVITRALRFEWEILQASPQTPFLSLVLEVQPDVVDDVLVTMTRQAASPEMRSLPRLDAYVSPLDQHLLSAVRRLLASLDSDLDRTVLAPLHLREITYRVLRSEQAHCFLESGQRERHPNAVTAAIRYMRQAITTPLTVADIADAVCMSESGFAHLFKGATGVSPLRFLRQLRLEQARSLLLTGSTVGQAASQVGYSSVSHFIEEFKRHHGQTPRSYTQQLTQMQAG
jgi:AraC-like DNA-binding protein